MKHNAWGRFFSLLLVLSLLLGLAPATYASERKSSAATFKEIPDSQISANLLQEESLGRVNEECTHAPEDTVRASIVLDKKPVLAIYSTNGIAANASAQQYRETVHTEQQRVEARISKAIGQELDVVWNLTITANVISANIRYGDLDKIAATEGVAQVLLETRYTPCVAEVGGEEPNMASATTMTGSNAAWLAGYTGAGSRIAIIDTGLDIDHQSVNEAAFLYALEKNAEAAQTATDSYLKELNLLDVEEIAQILPQLNIYQGYRNVSGEFIKDTSLTADELYRSSKIAFGYNYIDRDLDVTHDNDDQGGHGSHVAGIAAANRYIPSGDGFTAAASTAHMTGVAPDAQLMIMKVFGKNQGAYDSDYMAAIEDAILLGADVINLSLGSSMAGFTTASAYYQGIVDSLSSTDVVVVISAGNNSAWSVPSSQGYLYAEDVNFHTGGSPGTYQNAFTVASVDNCGMTAPSFRIGNHVVTYAENQSGHNAKLTTLDISADHSGTDYDYVVLNGPGKPEDYANMDVAGKVIYISRGELNFSDKLTYAAQAGAAACIIYNNAAGAAPNMNLADSPAAIPCVGITQADADTIKAISQMVQDEAGNALYYIGTMRIGDWVDTVVSDSEYNTMSDFSSWGVPGDLSLKPEITSPGGNIYSIDGDTSETDRYIVMSGTSMAAPHVAGLIALLSQYIHENGLAERLHISPRVLSQSLLMSTATPIVDGGSGLPYPVIQQGAGLGNVYNAMNAVSYVLVEGQDDGKVKAELGDDSSRTGEYGFDFTLHNMTGEAQRYTLDTQMYTQAWFESHISANLDGLTNFTDYSMTQLDVQVAYFVDGKEILSENGQLDGLDFNGDGSVDQLDGQTLLDYITGKLDALENLEKADLSGDGKLTAYDAELFLAQLGNLVVTLPANETVTVSVKLKLPQSVKNQLDEIYPNGAYLEGYVTATPMATAEGVIASAHSIPVLGFYGGWDEAPMFDRLTHTQIAAGTYTRNSYIPSMFISDFNYVLASDGENLYYLGGNPYATDAAYLPERNAIRSGGKEMIAAMNFNLIRNAGILRASVTDADTGAVYAEGEFPQVYSSFYHPASGAWQYMSQHVVPGTGENGGWNVTDAAGVPLAEGTRVHLTLQAAPEYYVKADGDVDWDTLHSENSILRLPVTVDNTAPVLKELSIGIRKDMVTGKETNYAEVVVQDNLYTAAVLVLTPSGSKVIQRKSANQAEPGVPVTIRMDTSGDAFKLAVIDYAGNVTYYDVTASSGTNMPVATLYGATGTHDAAAWYRFSSDTNFDNELILETEQNIKGAVYADGYVFYCGRPKGAVDDQAYLYVTDYPSFDNAIQIGPISASIWTKLMVESIAYHPGTGSLYFIKYYENNAGEFCTGLYALDPANAKETRVGSLDTTYDYSGLAYSQKDGCFYIIGYLYGYDQENGGFQCPTKLYRFSLPEDGETITLEEASDFGVWNTTGGELMLDEKNNVAYIFRSGSQSAEILTYDFDTNTLAVTGQTDPYTAICLPDDSTANHNGIVRTVPTSIDMNVTAMNLFVDETKGLSAEVGPWCLDNKRVTWTSSNPDVATVDADGKVTGVAKGTATIVAASVLDNTLTATCVVSVIGNDFTFHGVGSTADGKSQLFTYDSTSGTVSGQAHVTDMNGTVIPVESAMLTGDGAVWVQDNVVDNQGLGYRLHSIDTATGQSTFDSDANTNKEKETSLLFCDLVYDSWNHISLGVNGSDNLYMSKGDISPNQIGNIIFADLKGSFTAVTVGETWTGTYSKYTRVYLLDIQKNRICIADVSYDTYWGAWSVTMQHCPIQADLLYEADRQGQYQDSLVYDTATGTPILFHYTKAGTEIYALTLDQTIASFNAIRLGSLDTYQNVAAYSAAFHGDAATVEVPVPVQGERHLAHATEEDISMGTTNLAADTPQKDSNGVISINLLAEESAASGMVEIRLGHHITLVSVESSAQLSSYQESNGNVIFAYAGSEAIAEGDIVAVLRLKDIIEPAAVTVIENERSGQIPDATPTVIEFGHAWGEWTVIQEATCTANGQEIRTCSICHETETREIEANNNHCPSQNFTDLDTSSWYHESVDYVLRKGWIIGIGNTKFAPHAEITRGMIITILYRLAGEPEINGSSPFNDVVEGRYYTNAVIWAYENQIAAGMTSELFAPNTPATREQLVTFLYRYAQSAGFKASAQGSLNAFPDGDIVSGFAKEAVTWAVASGLLQGDTNGRLLPRATATRAQAAEVLYRYATVIA